MSGYSGQREVWRSSRKSTCTFCQQPEGFITVHCITFYIWKEVYVSVKTETIFLGWNTGIAGVGVGVSVGVGVGKTVEEGKTCWGVVGQVG